MFLYLLLIAVLAVVIEGIVIFVFNHEPKWLCRVFITNLCVAFTLILVCLVMAGDINDMVNGCHTTYDDLMLYYSTVTNSTNEYVRYDYYNKVQKYNKQYLSLINYEDSFWVGNMLKDDWNKDFSLIDFRLHGDNYAG